MGGTNSRAPRIARFADCTLDCAARELRMSEGTVHLSIKAFQLLEYLALNADRAVSKEELYEAIWGRAIVAEVNVSNLISEVRAVLHDSPRTPRVIKTVHRFGYRLIAPIIWTDDATDRNVGTEYVLVGADREYGLLTGENVVGRSATSDIHIPSRSVSRRHSIVFVERNGVSVVDLNSKNGTYVNGQALTSRLAVTDGDTIRFGDLSMVLRYSAETETTTIGSGTGALRM
jgi:DNA-binding winged helix-turn-helix (wHTH) protein